MRVDLYISGYQRAYISKKLASSGQSSDDKAVRDFVRHLATTTLDEAILAEISAKPSNETSFMTVSKFAELNDLNVQTVRKAVRTGKVVAQINGKIWLINSQHPQTLLWLDKRHSKQV